MIQRTKEFSISTYRFMVKYYQRIRRGYSDEDLKNLDTYFADMLSRALSDFKHQRINNVDWRQAMPPATDEIIENLRLYAEKASAFSKDRGRKALKELADVIHKFRD